MLFVLNVQGENVVCVDCSRWECCLCWMLRVRMLFVLDVQGENVVCVECSRWQCCLCWMFRVRMLFVLNVHGENVVCVECSGWECCSRRPEHVYTGTVVCRQDERDKRMINFNLSTTQSCLRLSTAADNKLHRFHCCLLFSEVHCTSLLPHTSVDHVLCCLVMSTGSRCCCSVGVTRSASCHCHHDEPRSAGGVNHCPDCWRSSCRWRCCRHDTRHHHRRTTNG